MEQLMHFAILQERNEITKTEELKQVRLMLKPPASSLKPQAQEGRVLNTQYYNALNQYLDQGILNPMGPFGLPFPSLNRADVFLYMLCDLPLRKRNGRKHWFTGMPCIRPTSSSTISGTTTKIRKTEKRMWSLNSVVD